MINEPILINHSSFQVAWKEAAAILKNKGWEIRNLVVHIADPTLFDCHFHKEFSEFCSLNSVLGPKDVAYTIFPHKLYRSRGSADKLFEAYNREGGLYQRLQRLPRKGWGTYFRRMTHYEIGGIPQNQLYNIIHAINERQKIHKAAYTILIQQPGRETVRPRSGPCLNYLAVQMEPTRQGPLIGLLGVYRNHDFLERAYGNYWALCNLICFLARETNSRPGPLTCISSHAYIDKHKGPLSDFLSTL
jgi:hypothetical protein